MARPGRMDKRIIIQEWTADSPEQDSFGEPSGSWATYVVRWAEKIDKGGREFFQGGTVDETMCMFIVRWVEGLTTKMRISYDGGYYDIIGFKELGRQDVHEITATVQTHEA